MPCRLEFRAAPKRYAKLPPLSFLLAAATLALTLPAWATMYKWVDADGKTVYSDQPPPANVKSQVIAPPPPPSNPDAVKDLINAETEIRQREKARQESAKEAQKKQVEAAKKQDLCNSVRSQIQTLRRDDLYRYNAKGEREYVDADTRQRETDEQQRILRENCPN